GELGGQRGDAVELPGHRARLELADERDGAAQLVPDLTRTVPQLPAEHAADAEDDDEHPDRDADREPAPRAPPTPAETPSGPGVGGHSSPLHIAPPSVERVTVSPDHTQIAPSAAVVAAIGAAGSSAR